MRTLRSNFWAWLTDPDGRVAGDSRRSGHNVFTDVGAEWLSSLVGWFSIGGSADVPSRSDRLRWVMVGNGSQAETPGVRGLISPLTILVGPNVYLRALPVPARQPTSCTRYTIVFTGASTDFDHHGVSVSVSEVGLFPDIDDGGGPVLSTASSGYEPVFYKSFDPLTKLAAQTLTFVWEFRC